MLAKLMQHYKNKITELYEIYDKDIEIPKALGDLLKQSFDCIKNYHI